MLMGVGVMSEFLTFTSKVRIKMGSAGFNIYLL